MNRWRAASRAREPDPRQGLKSGSGHGNATTARGRNAQGEGVASKDAPEPGTLVDADLLEIARVVKPHGLGGEVGVLLHWSDSDVLTQTKHVTVIRADQLRIDCEIVRARQAGRGYLVALAGICDRETAESLRGARLFVQRSALAPTEPGEMYLSDLIGHDVVLMDGSRVGKVVEVACYPSVDCLVIEREDGTRVEQPLVDDWVETLSDASGQVVLRSLEGLVTD